ncbi:hypothetical protein LUZ63_020043 [Rhynchospora breviuscula]|uniref:Uracil-DNA glycosylase-like domain-containing protein n=1 Tax=Rhynchospora breviuscula TaxID=2022672 RepID=A0A9P9Z9E7_9POAL|nr:hypothetical protein LUZ63_020043 [Rhynchospora breviuscula]
MELRVGRLENDVMSIYEMLTTVQTTLVEHTQRFDGIDGRLDGIDGRLDGIDGRLDGIDGRLDGIDGRLDGIDGRLDGIDGRLDGMDRRFDGVLPDVVGERPRIVFCGEAGADSTRTREHRYDTPGNSFWESLHLSGLVPEPLGPGDEDRLPAYGLGLTDLVGRRSDADGRYRFDVDELAAKLARWEPEWLAVTSKALGAAVARHLGERAPSYGVSGLELAGAPVYVLPGPSGANRRHDYDGRPTRLAWWHDLAALVDDPHAGER